MILRIPRPLGRILFGHFGRQHFQHVERAPAQAGGRRRSRTGRRHRLRRILVRRVEFPTLEIYEADPSRPERKGADGA